MTTEPNNPGYRPEYKELEEAQVIAVNAMHQAHFPKFRLREGQEPEEERSLEALIRWLAAEVRVMRLERALEQ